VPFVRFRVDRVLATADLDSAEGREEAAHELAPVFAELEQGTTQLELIKIVSERLDLPESLAEKILQDAAKSKRKSQGVGVNGGPAGGTRENLLRRSLTRREDAERAFLALCIATPADGAAMLASVDVDRDFSSEPLRRAARRLREVDLREPLAGAGAGELDADPELKALLAELVVEAGRGGVNPAMLEAQRLQLELARVEREIAQARGRRSGEVSELAQRKAIVKRDFDRAYARVLEQTGERE